MSPPWKDRVVPGGRDLGRPGARLLFTPLRKRLYVNLKAYTKSENSKMYVLRHLLGGFLLFWGSDCRSLLLTLQSGTQVASVKMKWTARQATCHCIFVFEETNQKAITENAHCCDVCLAKRATEITLGLNRLLPPAAPGSRRRHPLGAAHSVVGLTDAKGSQRSATVTDANLPPLQPDVPEEEPSFPSSHDHPVTGFSSKHHFI